MTFKFGQKILARFSEDQELERGIVIMQENGNVFVVWSPDKMGWIPRQYIETSQDRWVKAHAAELRQKRWVKAAERQGKDLAEYVYAMEQRKARAEAKRDADEKRREYWRKRQQAHREKKAEADGK